VGMRVTRESSDYFHEVCREVRQVVGMRAVGVFPGQANPGAAVLDGDVILTGDEQRRLAVELTAILKHEGSTVVENDIAGSQTFVWLAAKAQRMVAVPMHRGTESLGYLFAMDKSSGEFDSGDIKLLTSIANELAVYLQNAMLFSDVHDLMMGMLHSLTSAVDAKDAYTCGHSERVALLSRRIAADAGIDPEIVKRIYMAGLLHDVGKIGVPEEVLRKAGKLTPEEFAEMKKHPQIGARILSDVRQMADIIPGVLRHHERYDGKGYPGGLAGHDIPLMGRIICLADCFDAMTSNRPYRQALPIEVAMMEIRRCAGTQFDPRLADVFLRNTPAQIREILADHQVQCRSMISPQEPIRA
jgi:putative nucleotidyltransferase with HDIG domain